MDNEITTEAAPVTTEAASPGASVQTQVDTTGDKGNEAAPIDYAFEFPENYNVDQDILKEFTDFAKSKQLTKEDAQKLVNLQTKLMQKDNDGIKSHYEQINKGWVEASKSDKEFGGTNFEANLAVARKAVETFGTQELKELMDYTGVGNNPEVIRFIYRVGKAINEDKVHVGSNPRGEARDPAKVLFPSMA